MKTYSQKQAEIKHNWHLIDAKGQVLGRVAVQIAEKLIGKHKPTYTPNIDDGDFVVVINAGDVVLTGKKEANKRYYSHSGYPGGFRVQTVGDLREKYPERLLEDAVHNMLPKNRLRQDRMNRLKIYAGTEHTHQSQLSVTTNSEKSE